MHSYKAVLAPPVPGARAERPQYGHHFSDEGLVGCGVFGSFWRCSKKGLAHLLCINHEAKKSLVCETMYI
jgi:hypothetical protein